MPADLETMLALARMQLRDSGVKLYPEPLLMGAANEAKNHLVRLIRQSREDFFVTTTTGTITPVVTPNPTEIVLPTDFSELRNIEITTSGYEHIQFTPLEPQDERYRTALINGGSYATGCGIAYYWIYANSMLQIAPGFDIALGYRLYYVKLIPDLTTLQSGPVGLPLDAYEYLVTYMVCNALRTHDPDGRLQAFTEKLDQQEESIIESISERQIRDPKFVVGFMEAEGW